MGGVRGLHLVSPSLEEQLYVWGVRGLHLVSPSLEEQWYVWGVRGLHLVSPSLIGVGCNIIFDFLGLRYG